MRKPTSIRLEDDHADLLDALAQVDGASMSDKIREAVNNLLKERLADASVRRKVDEVVTGRQEQRLAALRGRYLNPAPSTRRGH